MKLHFFIQILFKFSLLFILISCNNTNQSDSKVFSNIQKIDIDINQVSNSLNGVFDKIELVALETNDSSIIGKSKLIKLLNNRFYGIMDETLVVHIFDKNGSFVSNSMKCISVGPNEYYRVTDFIYNKFSDQFELLDAANKIFCYDKEFNFKKIITITDSKSPQFHNLFSVDESSYLLTPHFMLSSDHISLFNAEKGAVDVLKYPGDISKLTMQEIPFSILNEEVVFSPQSINYSIFKLDVMNKSIEDLYYMNVLNDKIDEKEVSNYLTDRDRVDYLRLNSNAVIPVRNLVSPNYVVSLIFKKSILFTNIFDVDNSSSKMIMNSGNSFNIPQFFAIDKNILYAYIYPFDIENYIDINLLDDVSLHVLSNTSDEANPIIVKYYLK
jgi:hypothetical protein